MKSLWTDQEAAQYQGDLPLRVYTSRLLGRDKTLVLHGGGNTSVKVTEKNILGEDENRLYVKGSGWDLEFIEAAGFSPVRLDYMLKLAKMESLPDPQMVNELVTNMTRASAPTPSVETILHALLPHKFVDHTHADAVIAITNTANGEARIREIFGSDVVVIPYVMPGFDLARRVAEIFAREATDKTIGMVLLNHGIFSFGATAKESYERMIALVSRAEAYLQSQSAWTLPTPSAASSDKPLRDVIAALRKDLSTQLGAPAILASDQSPKCLAFARRADIAQIAQQGPATPDHVIRTKRIPMLGRDLAAYAVAYQQYFDTQAGQSKEAKTMLDAAPRAILDPELGFISVGRSAKDAAIVADIYDHTIDIIQRATLLGGYQALPAKDIFDVEYWDLEQAKLKKSGKPAVFTGEVVLITGAASGIGKACVDAFLARGAAVVGLDLSAAIETLYARADYLGLICDVTDEQALANALEKAVRRFGGVDMLVLNAGMFPGGCKISDLPLDIWQKVMRVNLDANLSLLRLAYPLLKLAPHQGRVLVMASKNVPAPGPGAAAYSASKAALTQLMRVAALEWSSDGIRINALHPDAVFDTGIWTEEVLAARAKHYGLTVDEYKRKNLLRTEITSRDVAELAAEMCGPLFAKTTGAQLPIDGGNDRVI